jgi:thymidylate synthase (FAD)
MDVLDKGFVRLDASMADDLSVVNSARVSLNKRSDYVRVKVGDICYCEDSTKPCDCFDYQEVLLDADAKLINFLMRERHGTPFEHNAFRFHVKAPIFVAREWMRHRIGSYNEWSGRYSVLEPDFYIPATVRAQEGKPGAYQFVEFPKDSFSEGILDNIERCGQAMYMEYERMLQAGVAKEQARLVLPVNIYTQFYWTINARSLMNFLSLRNSEQAMYEIRQYAIAIEDLFSRQMPITHKAFIANGRVAP